MRIHPGVLGWYALLILAWPFLFLWRTTNALAVSFRFWVLLIVAVLGLLIAYYAIADRYTPFSTDAYVQAYVVQVAPQVPGQVMHVHVTEGQTVKAGEPLFELDPRPFEHKVALLEAKLVEAEQQVKQLGTDLAAAKAEQAMLQAEAEFATAVHKQESQIFKTESTTERKYLESVQKHKASQAALDKAAKMVQHAQEALNARIGEEHALVAQVKAQLAEAQLNLAYSKVVSPCDGIVTDLQLREGAYVHVGEAALTVIDTSKWVIVANYRENSLQRLREGQSALVALQVAPGQFFPAHVTSVGSGVEHGQGVPSGRLPDVKRQTSWVPPAQRFQVRLVLDDAKAVPLRVGLTGSVSVYTEREGWLNDVTRGVHQLVAWLYYL